MAVTPPQWIIVPNWDKFQHYTDRVPPWIKLHLELNSSDEWLDLTFHERGVLVTVWVGYAGSRGVLSVRRLVDAGAGSHDNRYGNVMRALNSLARAGFIELSASKPLALARSREKKEILREETRARTPASDERPRAPAQTGIEPDRDAALAEAFDVAAGWDGPKDTIAFEDALDQVARKHHTKIPALDRDRFWDIAFGDHHDTH